MSNADGAVTLDTRLDTSGLEKDIDRLEEQFDGASDGARKLQEAMADVAAECKPVKDKLGDVENGLEGVEKQSKETADETEGLFSQMFSASAMADVAVEAFQAIAEEIKEFVIGSIEASADIQAENAQFEQTFRELEDTAVDSLKAIEKQTGITASRMKQSYTKTFAFTKSIGADSEEAMDIANRAMLAAADSAAYYDKSIEEATETLQSFLKGNFENDAALGIAATETTRNAKANELYAKSFIELSEAQKVDVLLAMVEAGNEASGALRQAAREADSWTNVTGELSEAMRQFQGVIGSPILSGLTPIIQGITGAIYEMIDATEAETMRKNMDAIVDAFEDAEKQFSATKDEIDGNAALAEIYADRLKELEDGGLKTADAQAQYAAVVAALNELMPDLNLYIDEQTGLVDLNTDALRYNLDAMKRKALYSAYEERYTAALKAQADASVIAADAEQELYKIQEEKNALTEILGGSVTDYNEKLAEAERQLRLNFDSTASNVAITQDMIYAAAGLTDEQIELYESLLNLTKEEQTLQGTIDDANATIAEQETVLHDTRVAMGELGDESRKAAEEIAGDVEALGQLVGETMAKKIAGNTEAIEKAFAALARAGLSAFKSTVNKGGRVVSSSGSVYYESTPIGFSLDAASALNTVSDIPMLATGAVIPPNAPFMAMLGDQPNGRNLEAPEGLIRQIVHDELGDMLGGMIAGFEASLAVQEQILEAIYGIDTSEERYARAVNSYNHKTAVMRGG